MSGHWKRVEVSDEMAEIAKRRTKGLLQQSLINRYQLNKLIASAYMQGILDAAETLAALETEEEDEQD